MKPLKLGAKLNISFAVVVVIPIIIATGFSIVYYSGKIRDEAVNTIGSDMKIAQLIWRNAETDLGNFANVYAQNPKITNLLGLNLGEKLSTDLATYAAHDRIDMITVVDISGDVLVRSHAPQKLNDVITRTSYIDKAFLGTPSTGTELLTSQQLEAEGFTIERRLFPHEASVMTLTGVAPVYDRQREKVIAVMIVRRILNNQSSLIKEISNYLNVSVALFEQDHLVLSAVPDQKTANFIPPSLHTIKIVLERNEPTHEALIRKGGSISKYDPIRDFNRKAIGVLMVQRDVESYLHTRNTAVITLLIIFFTAIVLAFIIKTLIERQIVIPVQQLKEGTERIRSGDYQHTLTVTSGDEIGDLTQAFNQMAADLSEYDRQLKEHNLQLEERVKERTRELQIANEQLIKTNAVLEDTLETLNPGVSKLIGDNRQQLGLVYGTELVADVCNYTKLNMILGETLMGEFMRKFFRESHKLLAKYRGLFDKTVGDQIVAIFGTPKDQTPASPIHPFDAISCAFKMVEVAQSLNAIMQTAIQDNYTAIVARHKSLSSEDRQSIKIEDLKFQCRIGINTSNPSSDREIDRMRMVMMGAETYVDYTAQGGAVIYAFRLENTGIPGEIHIGENTKRLTEHVYVLEELPPITLKGLGVQKGYHVIGYQSVFDTIYPKTRFYRLYCNHIPEELTRQIRMLKIGRMQIKEVRKIIEYLDMDISYLEHLAGCYNLCMARALFGYAVGKEIGMSSDTLHALVCASLWHNAVSLLRLQSITPGSFECSTIREQLSETTDVSLIEAIVEDLNAPKPTMPEANIIALCNQYDQLVFDRTYLKCRGQEIMPAKEVISLMKVESKFSSELLAILEDLMIAEDVSVQIDTEGIRETLILPKQPQLMAQAIESALSPEQRKELLSLLMEAEPKFMN